MNSKNKEETFTHRVFRLKVLSNGRGGGLRGVMSGLVLVVLVYYSAELLKDPLFKLRRTIFSG
jgi:hypothetical protein